MADHLLGTWDFVPDLSLYETGSPPTGGRYTITESAPGVPSLHVRWPEKAGGPSRETVFGGPADGRPQSLPMAAGEPAGTPEALTLTRVDARTLDSAVLARGAVIASAARAGSWMMVRYE